MADFVDFVQWAEKNGVWTGQLTPDWMQGRAGFGGLLAGGAVGAMDAMIGGERTLRSALVNFVGPALAGELQTRPRILRKGGSVTQAYAEVCQESDVVTTVSALFGDCRPTKLPIRALRAPETKAPDSIQKFPFLPGLTPGFTQHFDYRWATDGVPFSSAVDPYIKGWVRPVGGGGLTAAMLLGLLDAWPSPLLSLSNRPFAGSSATWQVNVYQKLEGKPFDWCLYESRANWSQEGFCDFEAHIWDEDGELIATSRQLFIEFSGR